MERFITAGPIKARTDLLMGGGTTVKVSAKEEHSDIVLNQTVHPDSRCL